MNLKFCRSWYVLYLRGGFILKIFSSIKEHVGLKSTYPKSKSTRYIGKKFTSSSFKHSNTQNVISKVEHLRN